MAPTSSIWHMLPGCERSWLWGKEKFGQITEPESTDVYEFINDRDLVIAARVAELIPQGFDLMFVHFPTPDWMGHEYGWLSPEQYSVLFRADEALQTILNALEGAGYVMIRSSSSQPTTVGMKQRTVPDVLRI